MGENAEESSNINSIDPNSEDTNCHNGNGNWLAATEQPICKGVDKNGHWFAALAMSVRSLLFDGFEFGTSLTAFI